LLMFAASGCAIMKGRRDDALHHFLSFEDIHPEGFGNLISLIDNTSETNFLTTLKV